jgi:hypothetical protein
MTNYAKLKTFNIEIPLKETEVYQGVKDCNSISSEVLNTLNSMKYNSKEGNMFLERSLGTENLKGNTPEILLEAWKGAMMGACWEKNLEFEQKFLMEKPLNYFIFMKQRLHVEDEAVILAHEEGYLAYNTENFDKVLNKINTDLKTNIRLSVLEKDPEVNGESIAQIPALYLALKKVFSI